MAAQPQSKLDNTPNANRPAPPPEGYDEKVIIACKVPLPWIDLQLCEPRDTVEQGKYGSKTVTVYERSGDIVRIRGTAYPAAQAPEGFPDRPEKMFGFAINRNISKAFWDEFARQYKDWPPVKNGFIFAFKKIEDIKAKASETRSILSGLEPMNPKGDPRNPKPLMGAITPLTVEEERGKNMPPPRD